MEPRDSAKRIILIHALADDVQVEELVKQLEPLEEAGKLRLWRPGKVMAGEGMEEALQDALAQADMVLLWVSPDLWYENPLYELLLQNRSLIPGSTPVAPILARASNWEEEPFLTACATNAIPASRQPVPSGQNNGQDAWFAMVAREVARRLGLPVAEAAPLPSPWKKWRVPLTAGATVLLLAAVIVAYLINSRSLATSAETLPKPEPAEHREATLRNIPCTFLDTFDAKALYIILPRFDDFDPETNKDQVYSKKLEALIDDFKTREKLAIRICSRWDTSINQRDAARQMMQGNHADLVIMGRIRKLSEDRQNVTADLKLNPVPSRQLIEWAGGQLDEPYLNPYQENLSPQDIEDGLLFMGDEEFENWLADMYNLKVGKEVPNFYYIKDDWPRQRKVRGYFNRGKNFFALNKYQEALSNAQIAIGLDSSFSDGYYLSGQACYEMEQWEAAAQYCNLTIALDSLHPGAFNLRGLCNEALQQYPKAIDDYSTAIAIAPTYSAAYNNRGLVKKQTRDYVGAIEDYDSALVHDPLSYHAYANRGVALARLGYIRKALADLDSAVAIGPANEIVLTNRGYTYYLNEDYQKAIEDCSLAIEVKRDYPNPWAVRGISRNALGDFTGALEDLNQALKFNPDSALIFYYKGLVYERQEWRREAEENYRIALSMKGNYYDALLGYGRINIQLRHAERAVPVLERACKLRPNEAEVHYELGRAYQMDKQFIRAAEMYEGAIYLKPEEPVYYHWRGHLHLRTARLGAALQDYWTAYTLAYPGTWWFWLALGTGGIVLMARAARKKLKRA